MSVAHEDHYGPWTTEQVLALGEDRGQRRELMGDALLVSPAPGTKRQRASLRLAMLIDAAVHAAGAPFEVLEAVNVVLPTDCSSRTSRSWTPQQPPTIR